MKGTKDLAARSHTRSQRAIRKAAQQGRLVSHCQKISGSWIIDNRPLDGYIGVREAAKQLHLSPRRVQQLCKSHGLPAVKIGDVWVVKSFRR